MSGNRIRPTFTDSAFVDQYVDLLTKVSKKKIKLMTIREMSKNQIENLSIFLCDARKRL